MNTLKILVLTSTALAAFATGPSASGAEHMTAGQHAAKAQELRQKAAVANQKAAAHEAMARTGGSPKAAPGAMRSHCDRLTAQYRAEAEKHSAQAAEHEQRAGSAALTRQQHLALAQAFEAKAAAAREKVAAHEGMSRGGSPKGDSQAMASHCGQLIAQYTAEAEGYTAKANEHRLAAE